MLFEVLYIHMYCMYIHVHVHVMYIVCMCAYTVLMINIFGELSTDKRHLVGINMAIMPNERHSMNNTHTLLAGLWRYKKISQYTCTYEPLPSITATPHHTCMLAYTYHVSVPTCTYHNM